MLSSFWGKSPANGTDKQKSVSETNSNQSSFINFLYGDVPQITPKDPAQIKEEVRNSKTLHDALIVYKPNGEYDTVNINAQDISHVLQQVTDFKEEYYVNDTNFAIPRKIYETMIRTPQFAENFIGLVKKGIFNDTNFQQDGYKGLVVEFFEKILQINHKSANSKETVELISSTLCAKFIELCNGVNVRDESEMPMKHFIKELNEIFKKKYSNSKTFDDFSEQFPQSHLLRQSVLNLLIQAYAYNKKVEGIGISKHGKVEEQLLYKDITKALENSNIIVEISYGAPNYKSSKTSLNSLKFRNIKEDEKAEITFLRVDTSEHNVIEHKFTHTYKQKRADYLAEPENFDKLLKLGIDPETIFNADLYKLQLLLDSPLHKLLQDSFIDYNQNQGQDKQNATNLTNSTLPDQFRKNELQNLIINFFKTIDPENFPLPLESEGIAKFLLNVLEYNGYAPQKIRSNIETKRLKKEIAEIFDYVIQKHGYAASFVESCFGYKCKIEYVKFSKIFQEIIEKPCTHHHDLYFGAKEVIDSSKEETYCLTQYTQKINNIKTPFLVELFNSGNLVIVEDPNKAPITLKPYTIAKLATSKERCALLIDSGLITPKFFMELSPKQLDMLLSPIGQLFIKCLVKNGDLGHFCNNEQALSFSLETIEHMRQILIECDGNEFSEMRQFLQKAATSTPVNLSTPEAENQAKRSQLKVFENFVQHPADFGNVIQAGHWGLKDLLSTVSPDRTNILSILSSEATLNWIEKNRNSNNITINFTPNDLLDSKKMIGVIVEIIQDAITSEPEEGARAHFAALLSLVATCKTQWKTITGWEKYNENFVNKLDVLCSNRALKSFPGPDCKVSEIIHNNAIERKSGVVSTNNIIIVLDKLVAEINRISPEQKGMQR